MRLTRGIPYSNITYRRVTCTAQVCSSCHPKAYPLFWGGRSRADVRMRTDHLLTQLFMMIAVMRSPFRTETLNIASGRNPKQKKKTDPSRLHDRQRLDCVCMHHPWYVFVANAHAGWLSLILWWRASIIHPRRSALWVDLLGFHLSCPPPRKFHNTLADALNA